MKNVIVVLVMYAILVSCKSNTPKDSVNRPNVVLIVTDDLGWMDVSYNGSSFYETPNIDALAKESVRFINGYASSPVCSPSRASIQTGMYPTNVDVTNWIPGRAANKGAEKENRWLSNVTEDKLHLKYTTIAEVLKSKDYTTCFIGKWHLGETEDLWPENQGYDINIGGAGKGHPNLNRENGVHGYFSPYGNPRLSDGKEGEYLTDRLGDETVAFMEKNKDKSFFVNLSFYQVHTPLQAKSEYVSQYQEKRKSLGRDTLNELDFNPKWKAGNYINRTFKERFVQAHPTYAAMVKSMDENVGKVVEKLKSLDLYDNTIIVFTSDNGGLSTVNGSPTSNVPLRGGKGWLYEGGVRVPFFIKRAGNIKGGEISNTMVSSIDIFPTILSEVGIEYPHKVDGINVLKDNNREEVLYWHYPHYGNQGGNPGSAIRKGKYKLIHDFETGEKLLFDLENDLSEKHNLYQELPILAASLYSQLDEWRIRNNAKMMKPNPIWNKAERIVE
ncbi:sulfatase [Maribacter thermophilus]|uniref:sulfatase n=1 Tax=Maribacter thermophilus TaxID=1197874 RepID=UPI0009FED758|nr:sulfatase [Maribacter thermophilus]